jgi:hypothetical protein
MGHLVGFHHCTNEELQDGDPLSRCFVGNLELGTNELEGIYSQNTYFYDTYTSL